MEPTNTKSARQRIPRGTGVVAVALIGAALGIGGALAVSAGGASPDANPPAVGGTQERTEALAEWARERGLTGLSPASLQRVPTEPIGTTAYVGLDALAEWARERGLTGLSPANMHRAPAQP